VQLAHAVKKQKHEHTRATVRTVTSHSARHCFLVHVTIKGYNLRIKLRRYALDDKRELIAKLGGGVCCHSGKHPISSSTSTGVWHDKVVRRDPGALAQVCRLSCDVRACARTPECTNTCTHVHTRTRASMGTHAGTQARMNACTHAHTHACTHALTNAYTHARLHAPPTHTYTFKAHTH